MSTGKLLAVITLLILFMGPAARGLHQEQTSPAPIDTPPRLIVKFETAAPPAPTPSKSGPVTIGRPEVDRLNQRYRVTSIAPIIPASTPAANHHFFRGVVVLTAESSGDLAAMAADYAGLAGVAYAEPDYLAVLHDIPDDSLYPYQWSLHNTAQPHHHVQRNWGSNNDTLIMVNGVDDADIDADEVYANPPDKTTTVVVAVIDTGCDLDHPDLADNIWTNPGEIPDNGLDDDHNGYVDDVHGWDFAASVDPLDPGDNDPTDSYGHGTHGAGIIAAVTGNGLGMAGIAPMAEIMPLKFDPLPLVSRIAASLIYAADNGADVVNMSFGMPYRSDLIDDALAYAKAKGVILCASSGNSGLEEYNFPAASAVSIAVGASSDSDYVTTFSTYGTHLSVIAPGLSILSLRADKTDMYGSGYPAEPGVHVVDSFYYMASGTSMSCPHVVGIAAFMRAVSPGLTPDRAQQILEQSADDIVDPYGVGWNLVGPDLYSGYGRASLAGALAMLPDTRAAIAYPGANAVLSGPVDIGGLADGADFTSWRLEYGPGRAPESWTLLSESTTPVTDDLIYSWDTGGLNGRYSLRLTVGPDNIDYLTVNIANDTAAAITAPADGEAVSNYVIFEGTAGCPDFSHLVLEYTADTAPDTWTEISRVTIPVFDDVIGPWYTEELPEGAYFVRLLLYDGAGLLRADTIAVTVRSVFSTDQAWRIGYDGYPSIIPNYGDLDNDGVNEIIIGTSGGVRLFDPDGTVKNPAPCDYPLNNFMIPPAVGDLDGDGVDDLVLAGYDPPMVYGFPSGGKPFESYYGIFQNLNNYFMTEHEFPKLFLKDIDGDGKDEIHLYVYDYSLSTHFLYDSDGSLIRRFDYTAEYLPVDLDGDGVDEIYTTGQSFSLLRQFDITDGRVTDSLFIEMDGSPFLCRGMSGYDIDNDGKHELILFGYFADRDYWIYAFEDGLNLIEGWPHNLYLDNYLVPTNPVFGDLNGDGVPEYVTAYFDISASYVNAYNIDGTGYFPGSTGLFATTPEPSVLNLPLLTDVDGDGGTDIVVYANNDMFDTYAIQRIYAWNSGGDILPGFPLITQFDAFTSDRFTPAVGDIDGDGNTDMIMTTSDSALVFINLLDHPYDETNAPAPVWRYDRGMSNVARLAADTGTTPVEDTETEILPESFALEQNFPNPFNPATTIAYTLPERSRVTVSVYNILGEKVAVLTNSVKAAGRHRVVWDGRNQAGETVGTGVYFYRLETDNWSASRKMLLVK